MCSIILNHPNDYCYITPSAVYLHRRGKCYCIESTVLKVYLAVNFKTTFHYCWSSFDCEKTCCIRKANIADYLTHCSFVKDYFAKTLSINNCPRLFKLLCELFSQIRFIFKGVRLTIYSDNRLHSVQLIQMILQLLLDASAVIIIQRIANLSLLLPSLLVLCFLPLLTESFPVLSIRVSSHIVINLVQSSQLGTA